MDRKHTSGILIDRFHLPDVSWIFSHYLASSCLTAYLCLSFPKHNVTVISSTAQFHLTSF